jgi:hypothetical protein
MEKKIVAFFIVVLLAGLIGGYSLSYVVYDLQTQNLKRDLDRLNDKLDAINSTLLNTLNDLQSEVSNLTSQVTNLDSTIEDRFYDVNTAIWNINSLVVRIDSTLLTILDKLFPTSENLKFTSAYAVARTNATGTYFDIKMKLNNTGSSTLTISEIFVNGWPWSDLANKTSQNLIGVTLDPGAAKDNGLIILKSGTTSIWKSGMAVEVMIGTAGGKEYPHVVILP